MVLRSVLALAALALTGSLAACGEPAPREDPAAVAPITTELAELRGWGPLTLGMSLDEVRATLARLALPITEERAAPASESLSLVFERDGDQVSAVFKRESLIIVALHRTYARDADARGRVAALEQAWGRSERFDSPGRNAGHEATHHTWRTRAIVVSVIVRVPGTGLATEYSEDYRSP